MTDEPAGPPPEARTESPAGAMVAPPPARWRGLVQRLNPAHLFFGPMFQRDVRAGGRKITLYVTRGLYALALLIVCGVALLAVWSQIEHESGAARLQALQGVAPGVTIALLWFQFVLIAMAAPAATASCVCDERNKRTLPALLTTPLTPSHIIFANLSSRAVNIIILTAILAPVLLALRVFGGVQAHAVFAALSVTLSTALLGAALGLFASIDARRPAAASTVAHILLAIIFFGPIMAIGVTYGPLNVQPPAWLLGGAFFASSPLVLLAITMEVSAAGASGMGLPLSLEQLWTYNLAINVAMSLVICLLAILRLRSRLTAVAVGQTPKAWARHERRLKRKQNKKAKRRKSGAPAVQPQAPTSAAARSNANDEPAPEADYVREVSNRPVLWRELRQPMLRGGVMRWILYIGLPLFLLWLGIGADIRTEPRFFIPTGIGVLVFVFIGAGAAAQCVTGEREGRTWDELLTSRLSGAQIMLPKIAAALRRQWPVLAYAIVYLGAIGVLRGELTPFAAIFFAVIMVADLTFLAVTGAMASLLVKKSSTASVLAIAVPLTLWAGLPMLIGMLAGLFRADFDAVMNTVFATNPLTMCIAGLEGSMSERSYGRHDYEIGDWDVNLPTFALIVLAHAGAYLTIAAGLLLLCLRFFNKLAGRAS